MEYKSSIKNSVFLMSVLPILLLGAIVTIVVTTGFSKAMHTEVENELSSVAASVENMVDITFPGDYVVYGDTVLTLVKGESILNDRFGLIDSIKADTGLEISILYDNIRFLTTVRNSQGERITGTYCSSLITNAVMGSGSAQFFTNAEIDDDIYFAYYKPLFNSDGSCVGMICVAKNAAQVNGLVSKSVYPVIIITIVMMVLVMLVSLNYSKKFIRDLTKLKDFLKQVEAGNFNAQFDYAVMKRNDEITDMCKSAVHMQRALGALIEHDALTGLYNRRSAGKFMHEMQKELADGNEKFALVLGDIDFFKKVNDTYGHDAGDEILKYVAQVLMTHMKGRGFASRWGGEEFLLGFKNATVNDAAKVSMEILEEIRAHILEYNGYGIRITMSFGVTDGRGDCNIDAVIKAADERLYYAKEHGRNRIVISEQGEIFEAKSASDAETDIQDNDKERLSEIDAELMDYIKQLNSDKDEGAS